MEEGRVQNVEGRRNKKEEATSKICGNETKAKTPFEKRGVFEQRLLEERLAGRVAYNDKSLITNFAVV